MQPINNSNELVSTTKNTILERIESEAIKPYGRWRFVLSQYGIWFMWAFCILLGALALAVTLYVGISANYAMYEATHENFLTFAMSALPYIWIGVFVVMIYVTGLELRNTKHGYRYSTVMIIGSSLFLSGVFSAVFHMLGFGFALDHILGQHVPLYMSLEKQEQTSWQSPESGRLLGALYAPDKSDIHKAGNEALNFRDGTGTVWRLSVNELNERENSLLISGRQVRLLGTSTAEFTFHVCGVFPFMFDRAMARQDMERERSEFDVVMKKHMRKMSGSKNGKEPTVMDTKIESDQICSHLKMMGQVQE
jgi:hypothetical protein